MYNQTNDYLLVLLSAGLGPQYRSELCNCVLPVCQVLYEIMWIKKTESNVYETNLDPYHKYMHRLSLPCASSQCGMCNGVLKV